MKIVIPGSPITKKNHQQIINNPRTHRPMIISSKEYKGYEKYCLQIIRVPNKAISYPVNIKCLYYMATHRRCDLVNLQEATLDILVKAGVITDDNSNIVVSMDGSRVLYDKENPRAEIYIEMAGRE